jgi:hypothetical protein
MMNVRWSFFALLTLIPTLSRAADTGYEVLAESPALGLPGEEAGYSVGLEFWNYEDRAQTIDPVYGWEGGNAAQRCAEKAWRTLKPALTYAGNPLKLSENGLSKFHVWIDDLSKAPGKQRSARTEQVGGAFNFRAVLDADGICQVPSYDELFAQAQQSLRAKGVPEKSLPKKPADLVALPEPGMQDEGKPGAEENHLGGR